MTVIVLQPQVPSYRVGLFDRMAGRLGANFHVYASPGTLGVLSKQQRLAPWQRLLGPMRSIGPGIEWQPGALGIPVERGDVVVVSGGPRCISNVVFLLKARLKGARTIWWGQYWSSTSKPWRAGIRMVLMRLADAILFYTDEEAAAYRQRTGDRRPVSALNNGIDTADIRALRESYHAEERTNDLFFIGRLTAKSELPLLLKALAEPACAGVTLEVVGSGEDEAGLRELAERLGVGGRVTWHGATTDERRIAAVANRSRLFVYPGAVGLSIVHALAYGLPAVVHDDRWKHMPEIAAVRDGVNGITFRRGDAGSLAGAIAGLLPSHGRLDAMSAGAIDTVSRSFNVDDMADRFVRAVSQAGAK